jgi:hypothetical protein
MCHGRTGGCTSLLLPVKHTEGQLLMYSPRLQEELAASP